MIYNSFADKKLSALFEAFSKKDLKAVYVSMLS
jgi:hypothetical protein